MKEIIVSNTTGRSYCPADCVRLVNMRQLLFYMLNDVKILDLYPSKDFKTGEDILVFIVDKKDSQLAYKKWVETRNNE